MAAPGTLPPRPHSEPARNTPRPLKVSHQGDYTQHSLDSRRSVARDEVQCVEVTPETFLSSVLPPVPVTTSQNVERELLKSKQLTKSPPGWRPFRKPPSSRRESEPVVYNLAFTVIVEMIMDSANPLSNLRIVCDGEHVMKSEAPDYSTTDGAVYCVNARAKARERSIDAGGTPSSTGVTRIHRENAVLCIQFKKRDIVPEVSENFQQILYDGLLMMKDPCRRFAFGVSVEDLTCRLYFFSRSHVMMTSFHLNKDWTHFVRFFTAVAIASDHQLGWDPTIERVLNNQQEIQYRYEVGPEKTKYQTVRLLSNFHANSIVGRATRVWVVVKLVADPEDSTGFTIDPSGREYALKDVWMDFSEPQEAILLKRIRHNLQRWCLDHPSAPDATCAAELPGQELVAPGTTEDEDEVTSIIAQDADGAPFALGENMNAPYMRYFPHIVEHGYVYLGRVRDDHEGYMTGDDFDQLDLRRIYNPRTRSPPFNLPQTARVSGSILEEPPVSAFVPKAASLDQLARRRRTVHYRAVYRDIGTPLDEVEDLKAAFNCLHDAAVGLRWLFRAGFVHRDISTGNVLFGRREGDDSPGGWVSDFEYCRPILRNATSPEGDVRTGTPAFMACEVCKVPCEWLFISPNAWDLYYECNHPEDGSDIAPFRFTPLHDLEPLLWMAVWTLDARPVAGQSLTKEQKNRISKILPDSASKESFIIKGYGPWALCQQERGIEPSLIRALVQTIAKAHRTFQEHLPGMRTNTDAFADQNAPHSMVKALRALADTINSEHPKAKLGQQGQWPRKQATFKLAVPPPSTAHRSDPVVLRRSTRKRTASELAPRAVPLQHSAAVLLPATSSAYAGTAKKRRTSRP